MGISRYWYSGVSLDIKCVNASLKRIPMAITLNKRNNVYNPLQCIGKAVPSIEISVGVSAFLPCYHEIALLKVKFA